MVEFKKPSCDKKLVVFYETIKPAIEEIAAMCHHYDIEYAMLFRTDEGADDKVMTSYSLPVKDESSCELSKETVLSFIEILIRRQGGRKI